MQCVSRYSANHTNGEHLLPRQKILMEEHSHVQRPHAVQVCELEVRLLE